MVDQLSNARVDDAVRQEAVVRQQMQQLLREIVKTLQLIGHPADRDASLKPAIGISVIYDAQAVALALANPAANPLNPAREAIMRGGCHDAES